MREKYPLGKIFFFPLVIFVVSFSGLVAALVLDNLWDFIATIMSGSSILAFCWFYWLAKRLKH